MASDRHVHSHTDGRNEALETPREFTVFPKDADEKARCQATIDFRDHNKRVYELLKKKGFARLCLWIARGAWFEYGSQVGNNFDSD